MTPLNITGLVIVYLLAALILGAMVLRYGDKIGMDDVSREAISILMIAWPAIIPLIIVGYVIGGFFKLMRWLAEFRR